MADSRTLATRCCTTLAVFAVLSAAAHADWFGSGENRFEIPFVTIGDPGNAADTTGAPNPAGRVEYTYRIGKYEVPEDAVRKANALSALDGAPLDLTLDERGPQKPATSLSWFEVARFVNWLNEDVGASPAYRFDDQGVFQLWQPVDPGYDPTNRFRNRHARYYLPSVDEWYKAAFYDPDAKGYWDYPTGSNDPPTPVESGTDPGTAVWNQSTGPADVQLAGGESPFGTAGQGGNVLEWQEGPLDGGTESAPIPDVRGIRGDDWGLASNGSGMSSLAGIIRSPGISGEPVGLRIASVPEPTALTMVIAGFLAATRCRICCS